MSLDLVKLSDDCLLMATGTTAGDVHVWLFSINSDGKIGIPQEPILTYHAHTMGANCISVSIVQEMCFDHSTRAKVLICSGGDDQAVSLFLINITLPQGTQEESTSIQILASLSQKEACASAVKGLFTVGDTSTGFRMFTTGYDQRLAIWAILTQINEQHSTIGLELLSSAPIDVKDINTLGGYRSDESFEHIVAGGEGLEVLSFNINIWQAAQALRKCNKLLITCGAGFSADSGLSTYETMPEEYKELCNPLRMVDSLGRQQKVLHRS